MRESKGERTRKGGREKKCRKRERRTGGTPLATETISVARGIARACERERRNGIRRERVGEEGERRRKERRKSGDRAGEERER